ncbi:MAG: HAMP domain-containing protein [Cellulosilyticum sp.]|nr:HAMP domain-containing protein [Cellulosilyticum sp.]
MKETTLRTKQILAFSVIILSFLLIMTVLFLWFIQTIRQMTYDKMQAQAKYYLETYEKEISHVRGLQAEFFNSRNLAFLVNTEIKLDDYEKRNTLLSLQEKLDSIAGTSNIVQDCIFYLPDSQYKLTQSDVRKMSPSDYEKMEEYLSYGQDAVYYDGTNFCSVLRGRREGDVPYLFVMVFSTEQIKKQLDIFNTGENSGNFIYNEECDEMVEATDSQYRGMNILKQLEKDETGEYKKVQEISSDGTNFLVFVGGRGTLGFFVQYIEESSIMRFVIVSWIYLLVAVLVMIGMSIFFIAYTNRIIHKPMGELLKAFEHVKEGDLNQMIYCDQKGEFAYIYEGFNEMQSQLKQKIDEVYVQTNLAQKAQLKQLQAQINPHFLYNSFFILSRRIKREDYENAEQFAKHLGNYFQFITRNGSDDVRLSQEVAHARSYAQIQSIRFAGRLEIQFEDLPEKFNDIMVPRLILQPLLENAFNHGLENHSSDGRLRISFFNQESNLTIRVEDNVEETTDEMIDKLKHRLENSQDCIEVTGIINIHKRLQGYFNNGAGVTVARSEMGGIAVSIYITCIGEGISK